MKTLKYMFAAFAAMSIGTGFVSCSEDDDTPNPVTDPVESYHFDLLVSVGATTGMSSTGVTSTLIRSVSIDELSNPDAEITLKGIGADVSADMNAESIIKGKYYYEAHPQKNTCFGKYTVSNTGVETVARHEFATNSFLTRQYTHAWIANDTLVFIGANRSVSRKSEYKDNEIMWTKLADGDALSVKAEGWLDLTAATKKYCNEDVNAFCTSGLATYRKSDNTIIYCYTDASTKPVKGFFIAFVDATTMQIKNVYHETRVDEMAGTAYGELQQDKMFFDDNQNLYIACGTQIPESEKDSQQYGSLVRVNDKKMEADASYLGINEEAFGKILTADYIGNNKCVLYVTNPAKAGLVADNKVYEGGWGQNSFNSFYYIYDIASNTYTELSYDGATLPASCGSFTDRVAALGGKAYIGVNPEEAKYGSPRIYVYDSKTGTVSLGARLEAGFYFNRLSVVEQ